MILSIVLIVFSLLCLMGAALGRMDGGGGFKTSEWTERLLIMVFFVVACIPFAEWLAPLATSGVGGIATGHGLYFPSRSVKAAEPERLDFIVRLVFGPDPRTAEKYAQWRGQNWESAPQEVKDAIALDMRNYGLERLYWRCALGMCVTGAVVGLPAAILALCFGAWPQAAIFALTGPVKAGAYLGAHKMFGATEPAEWANGGGRTALCLIALLIGLAGLVCLGV